MNNYRKINAYEESILEKLLSKEFPGRNAIFDQLELAEVKEITDYKDNWGSIEFKTDSEITANVTNRIPVQGVVYDSDGVMVEIFLHVIEGKIDELEIVKADNSPLKSPIDPDKIKVITDKEIIHE